MKGWKKIFHTNGDQKKVGVTILISGKIDFIIRDCENKEGHYIVLKKSIPEEHIMIICTQHRSICICTQHRSTTICKANANKYERGNLQ